MAQKQRTGKFLFSFEDIRFPLLWTQGCPVLGDPTTYIAYIPGFQVLALGLEVILMATAGFPAIGLKTSQLLQSCEPGPW